MDHPEVVSMWLHVRGAVTPNSDPNPNPNSWHLNSNLIYTHQTPIEGRLDEQRYNPNSDPNSDTDPASNPDLG